VCAIVGSLLTGKPVKWMEDRTENLVSTGLARDYVMRGEIAATTEGRIREIRTNVLADHDDFNGTAAPMTYHPGCLGLLTGSHDLRREQAEKRERGELMGIGVAFFTEAVGAGPRKDMDILGLGMADGCELRVHPTGKAVVRVSCMSQGQGHETTFAQIVAEE